MIRYLRYSFIIALSLLSTSPAKAEPPFYWDYINVDIAVQENGDMLITEEHRYVFTASHTNERFRYIPLSRVDGIEDVVVTEDGRDLGADVGVRGNNYWIRWSHDLVWPGSNRFEISYRVVGGLHQDRNRGLVYWKAVGPDRKTDVLNASVNVTFPDGLNGLDLNTKSFGASATSGVFNDNSAQFDAISPLTPGQELEVQVSFSGDVLRFAKPAWQQRQQSASSKMNETSDKSFISRIFDFVFQWPTLFIIGIIGRIIFGPRSGRQGGFRGSGGFGGGSFGGGFGGGGSRGGGGGGGGGGG